MSIHVTAQARYAFLGELIRERLPPPAKLVELGAAPGDQIVKLAEQGYAATAVDIGVASDGWADGTEGRMRGLLASAGVEYVEWDLEKTPYPLPDASFDGVLFTEVFEHLRDYPVDALREASRILRPGGFLFFTTPNAAYAVNRLRLLRGGSVYTPLHDWVGGVPHARHAREYLFSEIDEAMGLAGLKVVYRAGRHFHQDDSSRLRRAAKQAINWIATVRPTLGPMIIVVAQRPI